MGKVRETFAQGGRPILHQTGKTVFCAKATLEAALKVSLRAPWMSRPCVAAMLLMCASALCAQDGEPLGALRHGPLNHSVSLRNDLFGDREESWLPMNTPLAAHTLTV